MEKTVRINTLEESIDMLTEIALTSKHSNFEYIRSNREKQVVKCLKRIFKKALKLFKLLKKKTIKDYRNKMKDTGPIEALTILCAVSGFNKCINFYKEEINILNLELDEFQCYLNSGNRLKMYLGYIRTENELFNYKEAPIAGIEDEYRIN